MTTRTIRDVDLKGRRVLIRVDFNVPLDHGTVGDDTRIQASLPTIRHALDAGARAVILVSHLGRPKGKPDPAMSLRPVAARLGELLGRDVLFGEDCIGSRAELCVAPAPVGSVILLENLRFHPGEEKNDAAFAGELAKLSDVYVNDAFGAAHRAHASVEAIVRLMPEAVAGLLLEKELRFLGEALENPTRPFAAVLGGAKVSDKLELIENLLTKVDRLLVGGAMAYTFLKAMDKPVGRSRVEDDKLGVARDLLVRADTLGLTFLLPSDHVVVPAIEAGAERDTISVYDDTIGERMGVDIGPKTAAAFAGALGNARTVVWNGPMGVFEIDAFAEGTIAVARAVAQVSGTTIVGGGDSIAAIKKAGVEDRITHVSTGGGASLEFLGGRTLPCVEALGAT